MPVYGVPRDLPPHSLSFEAMVLDDPDYAMGAFDAHVDTSKDYSTWFIESFTRLIIGDVLMSGGRVLGGAIRAQVATEAEWRARVKTTEAKVIELDALFAIREVHMQEETTRALAREWEIYQRDREMRAAAMDKEQSQFHTKLAQHQGYSMLFWWESYEWLIFPFQLLLRFQAKDLSFLRLSLGTCQFLQARQVVGVLLLRLQGLPRVQGTLTTVQTMQVLPTALL